MNSIIFRAFLLLVLFSSLAACYEDKAVPGDESVVGPLTIGSQDENRQRELDILFWFPEQLPDAGQLPLLVFAHGLSGHPEEGTWLAEYLASYGYVVAAVKFPGTNRDNMANLDLNDLVNQPGDVSHVIDVALGEVPGAPAQVVDRIDSERVFLAGHSFGGLTTFLSAYDSQLMDQRLKAAIMLAAAGGDFLDPLFYQSRSLPMLLLHGDQDLMVDFATTSAEAFKRANTPRVLVNMLGGTHLGFSNRSAAGFNLDHMPCWLMKNFAGEDDGDIVFHAELKQRQPATGIGDYSAPPPCEFDVPDGEIMSISRQHHLSKILIREFLDYAVSGEAEKNTRFASLLENFDKTNEDIIVHTEL